MIVINFKTYPQSTGEKAVKLAKLCHQVAVESGVSISIGLQAADIYRVSQQVEIPIFAQHFDPLEPGRNTGWTTLLALKKAGASGVFLNHSEHIFPPNFTELKKAVKMVQKEKLQVLVFSPNLERSKIIDQFNPDYIALEEPTMVSGDTAMVKLPKFQELIKEFSLSVNSFPLIGAGIKTKEDITESLKLGVKGVVLASGFVKADDPKKVLQSLASAFK